MDLPINTNYSFEVARTHTDFLMHIQDSVNCHGTKSDLCALLSKFAAMVFLNSTSKKLTRKNERRNSIPLAYIAVGKGRRMHVLGEGGKWKTGH